jgi:hypothetical protein
MSQNNFILPRPAANLEAKIWARLETEFVSTPNLGWAMWQKWLLGSFVSMLVVAVVMTKLVMNDATQNQFNDLDRELALAEQTMISDTLNFEWDINPLEGN